MQCHCQRRYVHKPETEPFVFHSIIRPSGISGYFFLFVKQLVLTTCITCAVTTEALESVNANVLKH